MRLLLDTHPFLWFLLDRKRIPPPLMAILTDPAQAVYVSAVSVWEVTIKAGLGKLSLPLDDLQQVMVRSGFSDLSVTSLHALEVRHLPPLHRDPFDRLLIAQARHERMTLVTCDSAILGYQIDTLWD